ncbi:MAG TPA: oligopeptide/dipeptide ABC transporter ATP-binding protein, partial [Pedococcus sp.]|nr:oligopeptide/dipeptide ABC transporter ATP-binding protein [Pedococcus sp.]
VEEGPSEDVHLHPMHPYTHGLIQTIPVADPQRGRRKRAEVSGELPSAVDPPSGCRFRTRCPLAQPVCAEQEPPLRQLRPGHRVACHFPLETAGQSPLGPVSLGGPRPAPGGPGRWVLQRSAWVNGGQVTAPGRQPPRAVGPPPLRLLELKGWMQHHC